jgi:hypothetical protein
LYSIRSRSTNHEKNGRSNWEKLKNVRGFDHQEENCDTLPAT